MPIPNCFNFNFVVRSEIGKHEFSDFVLLFLWLFGVPCNSTEFENKVFHFCQKWRGELEFWWEFHWISKSPYPRIQMSFHLFSSLISFCNVLLWIDIILLLSSLYVFYLFTLKFLWLELLVQNIYQWWNWTTCLCLSIRETFLVSPLTITLAMFFHKCLFSC